MKLTAVVAMFIITCLLLSLTGAGVVKTVEAENHQNTYIDKISMINATS